MSDTRPSLTSEVAQDMGRAIVRKALATGKAWTRSPLMPLINNATNACSAFASACRKAEEAADAVRSAAYAVKRAHERAEQAMTPDGDA